MIAMAPYRRRASMMVSRSIALLLAIVAGQAPVAAESDLSARGVAVNACALLSADEISEIVQFKVASGVGNDNGEIRSGPHDGAHSTTCIWKASEDLSANDPRLPLGGARFVILSVMSWPAGSQRAGQFLQDFRDAAADQTISSTPVPLTIGDESLWWGDGVAVRKGDISYGISVHSVNERPLERRMAETLASKIAERL